jgi:hypothetical protein
MSLNDTLANQSRGNSCNHKIKTRQLTTSIWCVAEERVKVSEQLCATFYATKTRSSQGTQERASQKCRHISEGPISVYTYITTIHVHFETKFTLSESLMMTTDSNTRDKWSTNGFASRIVERQKNIRMSPSY